MLIRDMTLGDLDGVMLVESLSFKTPWDRASFESELTLNRLARYMVIEVDGVIVGYAGYWHVMDEGHITNVAIHPAFRKHGLGKALIAHLVNRAVSEEINHLTLEVRVSNEPAIALYKGFGFVSRGVRPKYYQDTGEDALIMWADLRGDKQ
ncbi:MULTISPECIES: ribosomal protein S18-alanine N-acetyltransferase [unclassified Fusibacter]|uniref:ribosomal protein S18-alanine N-acetyltransferase n=1 Tax=unclassified Fusibacter TaxID=2624464 RepID=UPI00101233D1|nr:MULTISPECIES: ribosomal protein S18-alanine N-acetyltransferase [unclassified Fusibacter]MCK8059440.1 ribosomal protein S18-alanine N-acetyltransferase [Fusibacter sp. A2]NPE21096.1 ribosomal protein S18-alanine N-acetyltransferase [Fusibacter sp. A1]RXV62368.1 ribosomal-protein-alanine N-acetyltransferase [Fusibacter sp. A1]